MTSVVVFPFRSVLWDGGGLFAGTPARGLALAVWPNARSRWISGRLGVYPVMTVYIVA